MTFKRRSYEETRDSVIRHITEGVVNERHGYRRDLNSYVLGYPSAKKIEKLEGYVCLLYTSPSPRDVEESRMPSSA